MGITATDRMGTLDVVEDGPADGIRAPNPSPVFDGEREIDESVRAQNPSPIDSEQEGFEDEEDESFFTGIEDLQCEPDVFDEDEKTIAEIWALLRGKKNINVCDRYSATPLHIASATEDSILVAALLAAGARQNVQDRAGNTPLHVAALHGNGAVIRLLLPTAHRVFLAHRNRQGKTAFQVASDAGHKEIAGLLMVIP